MAKKIKVVSTKAAPQEPASQLNGYTPEETQLIPVSSIIFDTGANYRPIYPKQVEALKQRFLSGEKQMETVQLVPVEGGYAPFAHQHVALAFKELAEDKNHNGQFEYVRASVSDISLDEAFQLSIVNQESIAQTSFIDCARAVKKLTTAKWTDSAGVEHEPLSLKAAAAKFGKSETTAFLWLSVLDSGDKNLIAMANRNEIPPRVAADIARQSRDNADPKNKTKQLNNIKQVLTTMEDLRAEEVAEAKASGKKVKPKAATAAARSRQALRQTAGTKSVGRTLREVREVFDQMSKDAAATQYGEIKAVADAVIAYIGGRVKHSSTVYAKIREAFILHSIRRREELIQYVTKQDKELAKRMKDAIKTFEKAEAEAAHAKEEEAE